MVLFKKFTGEKFTTKLYTECPQMIRISGIAVEMARNRTANRTVHDSMLPNQAHQAHLPEGQQSQMLASGRSERKQCSRQGPGEGHGWLTPQVPSSPWACKRGLKAELQEGARGVWPARRSS